MKIGYRVTRTAPNVTVERKLAAESKSCVVWRELVLLFYPTIESTTITYVHMEGSKI